MLSSHFFILKRKGTYYVENVMELSELSNLLEYLEG